MSVKEYKEVQRKIKLFENLMERIDNMRLFALAESRKNDTVREFNDFVNEEGFDLKELEELSREIEVE